MGYCRDWQDHRFGEPRFVEAGRHPVMGLFHRYAQVCERCERRVTETRWVAAPPPSPGERLLERAAEA